MDEIKQKAEEILKKLQAEPALLKEFASDPSAAIKKLTDIDLPADKLEAVIAEIKAKLGSEAGEVEGEIKSVLSGKGGLEGLEDTAKELLGGLFGKK